MNFFPRVLKRTFWFGILLVCVQGRGSSEVGLSDTSETVTAYNNYLITCYNDIGNGGGYATISIETRTTLLSHTLSLNTVNSKQRHTFTGNYISRACGSHSYLCNSLVILDHTASVNVSQYRYITGIVSLNDSIGLMVFKDVKRGLVHQVTHVIDYPNIASCLTLTVVKYEGSWLAVCVQERRRFFSCHILIDNVNISLSRLQCTSLGSLSPIDFQSVSNFVHYQGDAFITFSIANELFKLFPVLATIGSYSSVLPTDIPRFRLNFGDSSDTLYVYYNEGNHWNVILYDTIEEFWDRSEDHLTYSCFGGYRVTLSRVSSSISLHSINSEKHLNITGRNFTDGRCFGKAKDELFLVYVDQLEGIFVLNMDSGENIRISNSTCFDRDCVVPLVYADRYIILQEISNNSRHRDVMVKVVLFSCSKVECGCRLLVEVDDSVQPQLVGYVRGSPYEVKAPHPGNDTTGRVDVLSSKWIVITISAIGICLLILVIARLLLAICYCKKYSTWKPFEPNGTSDTVDGRGLSSTTEEETNMNSELETQPANTTLRESPIGATSTNTQAKTVSSNPPLSENTHEEDPNIMSRTDYPIDGSMTNTNMAHPIEATDRHSRLQHVSSTCLHGVSSPSTSHNQPLSNSSTNLNQLQSETIHDQNSSTPWETSNTSNSLTAPKFECTSNDSNVRSTESGYTSQFPGFPPPTPQAHLPQTPTSDINMPLTLND